MSEKSQPKEVVQKIYDDMAADYEGKIVPAARYAIPAWLEGELPDALRQGAVHVLDLGCGSGNLMPLLRKLSPRMKLTGMDLSPKMVEEARQNHAYEELFVHDLDLPLPIQPGATYDGALICGALEFVDHPVRLLADTASRLKGGACLMATFQLSVSGVAVDKIHNALGIIQHAYSESEVRRMLSEAGFRLHTITRADAYFSPSSGKSCPYWLTRSERV